MLINNTVSIDLNVLSKLNSSDYYFTASDIPQECLKNGMGSIECLYKTICPSISNQIIKSGNIIFFSYIIISWIKWLLLNYLYKYINNDWLNKYENRVLLNDWVNARLMFIMFAYIGVMIFLNGGLWIVSKIIT